MGRSPRGSRIRDRDHEEDDGFVSLGARVVVLHTWNPQDDAVAPAHAKGVRIGDVTEEVLCGTGEDSLLTIDYPREG